jgi:anti-anti-sigma factor
MNSSLEHMTIDVPAQARAGVLCVRVSGDVDYSDSWDLSMATPRIRETGAQTIFVDVGLVTFFGSTMVNFLVHLLTVGPGSELVICRPTPMARRVVDSLSLPRGISMRADLPPEWVEPVPAQRPATLG